MFGQEHSRPNPVFGLLRWGLLPILMIFVDMPEALVFPNALKIPSPLIVCVI
jgi:hypothetical protein